MTDINGVIGVRVVTADDATYDRTVAFYRAVLGVEPRVTYGQPGNDVRGSHFAAGDIELVVAREAEVTPEAENVTQGPVWLCFRSPVPDESLARARLQLPGLPDQAVETSFGTRAWFANDPNGLPVYVGTDWR